MLYFFNEDTKYWEFYVSNILTPVFLTKDFGMIIYYARNLNG